MGFGSSKQNSNQQSQQTSTSANQAFPFLQTALSPQVGNVGKGSDAISNLLGLNGGTAGTDAFNKFRDSSSFNFIRDQGIEGINASAANRGLLSSGSTLKGVSDYSTGLASKFLNDYLAQLSGLSNTGIQASGVIANAGQTSTSQGTSTGNSQGKSTNFSLG